MHGCRGKERERAGEYRPQLEAYSRALEEITGKRKKFGPDGRELTFAAGWPEQDTAPRQA